MDTLEEDKKDDDISKITDVLKYKKTTPFFRALYEQLEVKNGSCL